ncbi:MAG: NAD(P)-dependent oxidoreductase [Gammaproteobacteria bacterium]|nr:NAD(P)-dependent oxidoreductase [Gammaproteobacteria bacterium]
MKILVTGATGFIGNHVVNELLASGHSVVATSKSENNAINCDWYGQAAYIACDIYKTPQILLNDICDVQAAIHLSWPGLPNYNSLHHIEENLHRDFTFIKNLTNSGIKQVLIAGTCFEYGLQDGCLSENTPTAPVTAYGMAKDSLHKFLRIYQQENQFTLQWTRLFYLYGPGQGKNSIISQLDLAINNNVQRFNMSQGEQLRDYMDVRNAAKTIVAIMESKKDCVINCCSGKPISIRRLVEEHIQKRNSNMQLNLGYYKYLDYEPLAFWGCNKKSRKL